VFIKNQSLLMRTEILNFLQRFCGSLWPNRFYFFRVATCCQLQRVLYIIVLLSRLICVLPFLWYIVVLVAMSLWSFPEPPPLAQK